MARQKKYRKDKRHRKNAPVPQGSFPFLRLLPELRNRVYEMVMEEVKVIIVYSISTTDHKTRMPSLAQTCKQLRAEFGSVWKYD
jgi:hypothetical protein